MMFSVWLLICLEIYLRWDYLRLHHESWVIDIVIRDYLRGLHHDGASGVVHRHLRSHVHSAIEWLRLIERHLRMSLRLSGKCTLWQSCKMYLNGGRRRLVFLEEAREVELDLESIANLEMLAKRAWSWRSTKRSDMRELLIFQNEGCVVGSIFGCV